VGSHSCRNRGVAIGLEAVSELLTGIEGSVLDADWDALANAQPIEPDVMPEDEQELCRLIAETERLQMLIASYLAQVHADLEEAPQLRRAAAAYTTAEGFA
jgi:hypothetical protein